MIHFGINPTGSNGVDIDSRSELDSEIMSEVDEGGFGSVIGDAGWEERVDAVGTGDIDDFSISLLLHDAADNLAGEEWANEIGSKSFFPIGDSVVGEFFVDGNAGVVDEDVDFAESSDGLFDEGLDVSFLTDVGKDDDGVNMVF